MPTTPSKLEQEAESAARAENARMRGQTPIAAGETAAVLEVPGDTPQDPLAGQPQPTPAPAPAPAPAPEPKPLAHQGTLGDQSRAAIMARFRTERPTPTDEADEMADFVKSGGMPEEFRQTAQPEAEPAAAAAEAEPAPAPESPAAAAEPQAQTVKVKVRGEEKEVPLDEALAMARKAYAAEDYLDEAKGKLSEVNALLRETRDRATRPAQDGQPQAAPNGTHAAEPGQPSDPGLQPQEDPFQKTVEAIQFGDPAEAKNLLRNTIDQEVNAATQRAIEQRRIQDDAVAANKALAEFSEKHADVANDPMARAAIEAKIFEQQATELKALNVDFGKIRTDGRQATPADIANTHQILRSRGFNVSSPGQLLEAAHGKFLEWRGTKTPEPAASDPNPAPNNPAPQPRPAAPAPRVQITVDRQARQAAPQPQPQATRQPKVAPVQRPADPVEARSSIVQEMIDRKARQRGGNPYVMGRVRAAQ